MKRLYFDIETGPRPEAELRPMMPEFSAPSNYKDPAKIAEVITEKQNEWLERAALCATTGVVLAIGTRQGGENRIFATGDERLDLEAFWKVVTDCARTGTVMVGFNIARFDIPFLMRRSWFLGVQVPAGVIANGRYLNQYVFQDLYEEWQCGDRGETISLKRLSEFLGVGTKDKDGALSFAEKFVTDRKAAMAYLENDLVLTEAVAVKLIGPESTDRPELPANVALHGKQKTPRKPREAKAKEAPAPAAAVEVAADPAPAAAPAVEPQPAAVAPEEDY